MISAAGSCGGGGGGSSANAIISRAVWLCISWAKGEFDGIFGDVLAAFTAFSATTVGGAAVTTGGGAGSMLRVISVGTVLSAASLAGLMSKCAAEACRASQ